MSYVPITALIGSGSATASFATLQGSPNDNTTLQSMLNNRVTNTALTTTLASYATGGGVATGNNSGDQFTNMTSSRLLGRLTAGFGAAEELSKAQIVAWLGLDDLASDAEVSTALAAKLDAANLTWANVANKPTTFTPSSHTHVVGDITNLQTLLDGKQPAGAYLTGITGGMVTTALGFTPQPAGSYLTAVTKADVGLGNVDNTSDASKPVSTAQATAIALKLDASQKGAANGVAPLDATGKVPSANLPASGGSPYWNEITLTADYVNAAATFANITDGVQTMTFTPTANATFEVQAALLIQTSSATNLPRIGVSIGAGQAFGAVQMDQTGAALTARVVQDGTFLTAATTVQMPVGGLPAASTPSLCYVTIRGKAGASPGAISLQMACETAAASTCRVLAGSQMRYKNS